MTRSAYSTHVAISDPKKLEQLGVNLETVGLPLKGRWALQVHECHHPMGALRMAGTASLTDGECTFNNGKSIVCQICGGRWQRNVRAHPDTNISVITGQRLLPYEIGIPLPLPQGTPWSEEAVQETLRLE